MAHDTDAVRGASAPNRSKQRRALRSIWIMGPVLAVLQGFLVNSGMQGKYSIERAGYTAGTGDHYVLGPEGLQSADPTRFVGDFFMDNAPEPHWFFDIVTALGASTDLSTTYLIYWFFGLAFFGFGAAMLARQWAPRFSWLAGIVFTVLMFLAPWAVAGTGSPMISSPIPAVVGGYAAFFAIAALLSGRYAVAAVMATVTSVLHVQQGLVVALVFVVTLIALWVRHKRPVSWLLIGVLGSVVGTAYGMLQSSFGGAIADFVRVCDEMIPYHCSAHMWGSQDVTGTVALVALSAFSVRLVPKDARIVWYSSVGLMGFGLLSGMFADILRIPMLGELAQGSNIYRLGAVVIFFTVWGLLSYLVKPAKSALDAAFAIAWVAVLWVYLSSGGWQFTGANGVRIYLILLPVAVVIAIGPWLLTHTRLRERPWANERVRRLAASAGTGGFALILIIAAVAGGFVVPRPLDPSYIPDADKRAWGAAAEAVVPSGELLLQAPNAPYIRLTSKRGNIGDCKSVPYGGKPYEEWKQHLDDLGGWEVQCRSPFPSQPFNDLSAGQLNRVAEKYELHYMVLEERQLDVMAELEEMGWTVVLEPMNDLKNYVLKRG